MKPPVVLFPRGTAAWAVVLVLVLPRFAGAEDLGAPELAIETLRSFLADEGAEGILYRLEEADRDEPRWVSAERKDGTTVERPNPAIPHRSIAREDLLRLAALATPEALEVVDADLLSHSFGLEVVLEGEPVARLDFHTKGFGKSTIFLIDHTKARLSEGYVQLGFRGDGRKAWMEALGALWRDDR